MGRGSFKAMNDFRYTVHQVARGSRPDATVGTRWYLVKKVRLLRLTYQIRLLTFLARERDASLVIRVPRLARLSRDLQQFTKDHRSIVRVEKAD